MIIRLPFFVFVIPFPIVLPLPLSGMDRGTDTDVVRGLFQTLLRASADRLLRTHLYPLRSSPASFIDLFRERVPRFTVVGSVF